MVNLGTLEGMSIGAVSPVIITADTPIDYSQWDRGRPWHTKRGDDVLTSRETEWYDEDSSTHPGGSDEGHRVGRK